MKNLIMLLLYIFLISTLAQAGTTGKIAGRIIDADTGDPLPMVNVIIENSAMGAASDLDGYYIILHVAPGIYTLKVSMLGYSPMRYENVRVSIDLTTNIEIQLSVEVIVGQEITIVAERPMITKDLTATTAVMGADEISKLPVTEISEAIALQAGLVKDSGGGLHIRGGRSGEVSYWIDGIPVTDVYDGGTVVEINKDMVQELQVVSGAFNAEYGHAMSGIVNIATKSGSNNFGGSFTTYFGDNLSNHTDQFMNIDDFNPVGIRNFDGSIHGAIIKDKLFYYANSRYINFDGWLYGQRKFNPNTVAFEIEQISKDFLEEHAPEYLKDAAKIEGTDNHVNILYTMGTNAFMDSLFLGEDYDSLRQANFKNGKGDNKYVPMNWNRKIYGQVKLIYKPIPALTVAVTSIYDDVDYKEWGLDNERDYKYNPNGAPKKFRSGLTNIFKMTHMLSSRTFYELGMSYFIKEFQRYTYKDMLDSRYVHPNLAFQIPNCYKTAGTDNKHFRRRTDTFLSKFDITSQITNTHQVKAGIEFRRHEIYLKDITLQPEHKGFDFHSNNPFVKTEVDADSSINSSSYLHNPIEFSAYIQDKMEFKNMIVNLGVRIDYFDPDGRILSDEADPFIYLPIKPENNYYDFGTDGIPNTYDADGTENNGSRDPGEKNVTLADRQKYWYKKASSKFAISPRIGVSFPITDKGVIHFSYGHFFQVPRFERLYQNPDFQFASGNGNLGVVGNADLEPEQTINGEIGLQQQLTSDITLDITGYFRDIRNLAGTRGKEILIPNGKKYSKIVNSDFGFIRGFIVTLNKHFSGGLSASIDYTLQQAKGTNSDPEAARNALAGGSLPEVHLTPLDWDQRHTINTIVSYSTNTWGSSFIGQFGSGLPYTPTADRDISTLLNNSQLKSNYLNIDFRAYKDFHTKVGKITLFARIFNLLDRLNEVNVYSDSGQAGFTIEKKNAELSDPTQVINTLDDWFTNPTHYSEPRRIEIGLTFLF